MKIKKGLLKVVAKTGGIKIDTSEAWINPADSNKSNILENLEKIQKMKGKSVVLEMETENTFIGILLDDEVTRVLNTEKVEDKAVIKTETKIKTNFNFKAGVENLNILEKLKLIQTLLKVPKNNNNDFGNYKYRNMSDILESVKPLLEQLYAVIIVTDEIVYLGDRFYIKSTAKLINSIDEKSIEAVGYARESKEKKGMDSAQITGSASSYARKYALNGLLAIDDTKDIDSLENHNE